MKINFNKSIEYSKKSMKVPRGDDDWYKHSGVVIRKMYAEYPEAKKDKLFTNFLVAHMIDLLLFDDKLSLLNYLYSLDNITENTVEWYAKMYFETNSVDTGSAKAYAMYKLTRPALMILNDRNTWVEAEPEDYREINMSKNMKEFLMFKVVIGGQS